MSREPLSEIPMEKVKLKYDFVEAIEVTAKYVYSLPNAGAVLQRFGEQVEILHPGPHKKKVYAQVGEYIVSYKDANGNQEYIVISPAAFKGLFQPYAESASEGDVANQEEQNAGSLTEVQTDVRDIVPPLNIVAPPAPPVETEAQKKAREKEEAKQKRKQELQELDVDSLEKPLGEGQVKE